ncbi:MAG: DnaA/Hda family protein [Isosphaeraceae bacterium]
MAGLRPPPRLAGNQSETGLAPGPSPHPWQGLIVGPENELALAGAQAIASGRRDGLSPLILCGPSGVGKTRLLAGLVAEWLHRRPAAAIVHLQGVDFRDSCLEALQKAQRGTWSELHARFRTPSLLVLDDLEGLEGVPVAQDELAHTLDALDAIGSSVAASCHHPPAQWPRTRWSSRLVSRLAGGLLVRIEPPGFKSRRRYLLERARARGLCLAADAVESLASSADGYRTLDGWLAQLALRSAPRAGRAAPAALDLASVTETLAEETELARASITVEAITKAVAAQFRVRTSAVRGPGRQAGIAQARHLAMYLARLHTGSSLAAIGRYFGGRDPATVRHACKAAAARLADDPSLAASVALLRLLPPSS